MAPGNLFNSHLHKFRVRVGLRQRPYVLEISGRESLHFGKFPAKINSETIDDLCAPALRLLSRENVAAYLPIEQHELSIY
jgi:hypothetical protein